MRLKFRALEMKEIKEKEDDVYSPNYVPKKYSKNSAEYGRPKPGTLTEMRAKKAGLAGMWLSECDINFSSAHRERDGRDLRGYRRIRACMR